jgi:adenosylmethionine-8-amino-7-oxononanoate aminotransferase
VAHTLTPNELQQAAKNHLWLHYTTMSDFDDVPLPIIVRGEGCHVENADGRRLIDGMSGLFCVNLGYSYGEEIGQAAAEQMAALPYSSNWSYSHPRAVELAKELGELAPGDLERSFLCSGGSEAVESAWKLARQYYAECGERRWKVVSRNLAWHGASLGALSITGMTPARSLFEPLVPDVIRVSNTNRFRRLSPETEDQFTQFLLQEMRDAILHEGPETIAMVILEPVQNLGGSFVPPRQYFQGVRDICDEFGILLCADEVICGFGRLGTWFGSQRYDVEPDLMTCAKGLSSGYSPIGAMISSSRVSEPFLEQGKSFMHGFTFGGHPLPAAIALKVLEIIRRDGIIENVQTHQAAFRTALEQLLELPMVGDVRGAGYFQAIELVSDPETNQGFTDEESEHVIHRFVSRQLYERGLLCRSDDRADPVIQLCPPLIAGPKEFDEIVGIIGDVLEDAWRELEKVRGSTASSTPEAVRGSATQVSS